MKAKFVQGIPPGGKREILADLLPLSTPMLLQYFPIYACNFKCKYCVFSMDKSDRGFISDDIIMDFDLFKKTVDEIHSFPDKIKVVRFVGMGEPLLHKRISEMVEYIVKNEVAERVEILTNGSLLTHEMSDALISAGLTRLLISLQGTSARKYLEISDVKIDFDEFVDNIRYYYEHKGKGRLHVKIIDIAFDGKADEQFFYRLFGDITDTIGIEIAGPIFPDVALNEELSNKELQITQFGRKKKEVLVCPQPFFTMQINPDGNVVPCYSIAYPRILGNCTQETLPEIWNGERWNHFRVDMLSGITRAGDVCKECNIIKHRFNPEDSLNNHTEVLQKIYTAMLPGTR